MNFQFFFRECKSYSDNPLCDYIDNDGKEGFGQGTDVRLPKSFAEKFLTNFCVGEKFLTEHLIRHCHCCMATYPCFTRNRFCPIRKPEIEKTRYFKDRLF